MFKVILRNDTENFTHKYFTMESVRKVPLDNDVQLELGERRKIKVFLAQSPQATSPRLVRKVARSMRSGIFGKHLPQKANSKLVWILAGTICSHSLLFCKNVTQLGPSSVPKQSFVASSVSHSFDQPLGYGVEVLIPIIYNAIYTSFVHTSSVRHSFDHSLSSSCVHVCIQNLHPIICPNLSTKSTNLTHKQTHRTILCHVVSGLWWVMLICYPKSILVLISGMLNLTPKVTQDNKSTKVRNTHFSFVKLAFSKCFKFGETVTVLMQYPK